MRINISQLSCFICQFSYTSYWFIPCFLPFSKWGASAGSGSVSLPNSKIPPLAVVGAIYCFVFPPILFFLSWLLIVWTVTWIYVACFPHWGSLWWKQSGRRVFPSMRPVPPYKASAEWMLSTPPPPVVVFPSCHLSSLFSPSPEWIPLILSTLALEGGTLLAGPTPAPPSPLSATVTRPSP